jgi:3-phosphoshikimate 1-carboxyvinyltransferase
VNTDPVAVIPAGRTAVWRVPGSKSITNRALVLGALADGRTVLENVLESDDTRRMREALAALGIAIADVRGAPGQLAIEGGRARLRAAVAPIFVGNSGTTVRFLTALAALVPGRTVLVGDDDMARRPIGDLVDALRQLGVEVECATGCPPLTVTGGAWRGGRVRMRGDRSSQYFSALLLCAGLGGADLELEVEGELVSRPYVAMTQRMVADFGGEVADTPGGGFHVERVDAYRACRYVIEPDASSASYAFALAAAGRHRITVPALGASSLQGDYAFVEVLARMGARVERSETQTTVWAERPLTGIDVDMHNISDTVMTLAAIAPLCQGPTTIRNVANIRLKETDRLAATVTELARLGQTVTHGDDWLRIEPAPLCPATVACYRDHRIAMSFAVLGAIAGGVTIEDPACTSKTYPGFWDDLAALSAA